MKITLRERFGEYCLHRSQGRSLFLLLRAAIKMENMLEVDGEKIRIFSSDFLEESIGKLTKEFAKKQIYTYIKFKNLTESHEESIKFAIDFYYRYFHDKEFKKIIDFYFLEGKKEDAKKNTKNSSKAITISNCKSVVV